MRVADLQNKNIVIWGTGKEGLAIAALIRGQLPSQRFTFIDNGNSTYTATKPVEIDLHGIRLGGQGAGPLRGLPSCNRTG